MNRRFCLLLSLFVLVSSLSLTSSAQNENIALRLSVPDNMENALTNGVLEQFKALYPNVDVYVEASGGGRFGRGGGGTSLDDVEKKMQNADVALVNSSELSVTTTRADFFLNLSPIVSADFTLATEDYYAPVWQSYQWDNGIWALPLSADVIVMMYLPDSFDAAGVAYPGDWWSIADLADAARQLIEYDDTGAVSLTPVADLGGYIPQMLMSLSGSDVVDDSVLPAAPDFSNPALQDLISQWADLQNEGLVGGFGGGFDAPIIIGPSTIAVRANFTGERQIVSLPGGRNALDVQAFAVSSGTQYPDMAYELAKFLTQSPEVANASNGIVPARRSLAGIDTNTGGGPGGFGGNLSDEMLLIVQSALDVGIPISEARFSDYIDDAIDLMISDNLDAATALQDVEVTALDDLASADDRAANRSWVVEAPAILSLSSSEIVLNFGISGGGGIQQNNDDSWKEFAAEFAASDPEVGLVNVDQENGFNVDLGTMAETYDCFYMSSNAVQGGDLSVLRSLDPLVYSDPNFDQFDFVGNVFSQVQSNDLVWAYPLNIQPEVMLYNEDSFAYAGAFYPHVGWTVTDFENALRDLKIDPEDGAPFVPVNIGGTYIQLLLAAYGGIAVDYSTDPISLHFNDEATLNAAQQVLDLAKAGYIQYDGLSGFGGQGGRFLALNDEDQAELYNQLVNSFLINAVNETSYDFATFPEGSQNVAVAYDIGTAYISVNTSSVDPCYRFIQYISDSAPSLFPQMPARRSQLTSQALVDSQGADTASFYQELDGLMSQPDILLIPTSFSGGVSAAGDFLTTNWLYQAFDAYVLEDADLATELDEAQLIASSFQDCIAALPAFDPNAENPQSFFQEIGSCATAVDPNFSFGT